MNIKLKEPSPSRAIQFPIYICAILLFVAGCVLFGAWAILRSLVGAVEIEA